jgi:hypothetical protein
LRDGCNSSCESLSFAFAKVSRFFVGKRRLRDSIKKTGLPRISYSIVIQAYSMLLSIYVRLRLDVGELRKAFSGCLCSYDEWQLSFVSPHVSAISEAARSKAVRTTAPSVDGA